jgi:hypothetical protein
MHLNTIAGRSYNDITQYPVFPWVLKDYESTHLDLSNPEVFRDLSKPVGALNSERLEKFREKYEDTKADGILPYVATCVECWILTGVYRPFFYGSHYSSAGIALHYLLRLEPFTTLAIQLQSGRFDLPDRLFHSIQSAWHLSYTK